MMNINTNTFKANKSEALTFIANVLRKYASYEDGQYYFHFTDDGSTITAYNNYSEAESTVTARFSIDDYIIDTMAEIEGWHFTEEYFTEETNRFSRALLFPNHGIKFCKNCFTYQAALSGFVKAPHLAGSEKAILSGSVSKILHFCIAEQKACAAFVNSSKQRSDGGRQFAVCPKKSSFSPDKYQQRACPAKKWGC